MSEENNSNSKLNNGGLSAKDMLTPLSIMIAGVFVGAGLYFGGGSAPQAGVANAPAQQQQQQQQQETDRTGNVNEVTEDDHIKGDLDADIKIVEYSDFDCPFCNRFHDVMNEIVAEYPDDEVAWVYRQFPIEQLHPDAPSIAMASECVANLGGNDAFWQFADGYFATRAGGDETEHGALMIRLATEAGVDETRFNNCLESEETQDLVQEDMNNASETGGRGTPWSILIGPSGKTYPINGALPKQAVEQLIDLAKQEA